MTQLATEAAEGTKGRFARVPRKVIYLILALSVNSAGFNYMFVVIAAYLPVLGFTALDSGLLLATDGLAMIVAGIPFGYLSDRYGRKRIMMMGALAATPILFIFALTTNIWFLFIASIFGGIVESAFLTTVNAIMADLTDQDNRGAAFALSFILGTAFGGLGFAVPFAFPWLESMFGISASVLHREAFAIFGVVTVLSVVALWKVLANYQQGKTAPSAKLQHLGTVLKFSGANSFVALGAGFIIPLIPTWLLFRFNVPDTYSGPLLAFASVMMGLAAILAPRMAAKYGLVKTIVLNQGLSTVFMFSLAFVGSPLLAGVLYVIRATLMNLASPLADTLLMSSVSPEERGRASAINAIVWRFPNSITTIVGGFLLREGQYSLPFFLATAFYVAGISIFYHYFKDASLVS